MSERFTLMESRTFDVSTREGLIQSERFKARMESRYDKVTVATDGFERVKIDASDRDFETRLSDKPLAAAGWKSFRYRGQFGYVMIGASDAVEALRETQRSLSELAIQDLLEYWNGTEYVPVDAREDI